MHGSAHDFIENIAGFLGIYYLILAAMNAFAAFYLWHYKHKQAAALVWLILALVMVIFSPAAMSGSPPAIARVDPGWSSTGATGPVRIRVGTTSLLAFLFVFRRFLRRSRWSPGACLNAVAGRHGAGDGRPELSPPSSPSPTTCRSSA